MFLTLSQPKPAGSGSVMVSIRVSPTGRFYEGVRARNARTHRGRPTRRMLIVGAKPPSEAPTSVQLFFFFLVSLIDLAQSTAVSWTRQENMAPSPPRRVENWEPGVGGCATRRLRALAATSIRVISSAHWHSLRRLKTVAVFGT